MFKIVQLKLLLHSAFHAEVVESLADISSVSLVVVRDVLITISQGSYKVHQVAEVKLATSDQTMLGEDVGQQRGQLVSVSVLTQLEYVKRVLVYFVQFIKGLWFEVEHLDDECFSEPHAQLRIHPSVVVSLLLKGQAVVLEAKPACVLSKLIVPSLEFLPHVDLAEVGWLVHASSTHVRVTLLGRDQVDATSILI